MKKAYTAHTSGTSDTDYSLVQQWRGYNAALDNTILPAGTMIPGSQNVLTTIQGTIATRKGYTLDGQAASSVTATPVNAAFDFFTRMGTERNLRVGNGKMQFRYVSSAAGQVWNGNTFTNGQVFWIDMITGLTTAQESYSFTTFYDFLGEASILALMVNNQAQIQQWNGAVTTVAAQGAGLTTLTTQGTATWRSLGFNATTDRSFNLNGTTYTYTGGTSTTTLTGIAPALPAITAGSVVFQSVITTLNSAMTGLPNQPNKVIGTGPFNQIYIGQDQRNDAYISKSNNFKDYSFSSPRAIGDGAQLVLDQPTTAFVRQEDTMYISAGRDYWYEVSFLNSSTTNSGTAITIQTVAVKPLKTSTSQGALNASCVFKAKNSVYFINNEPAMDELGRMINNFGYPQATNYSDSIKNDFDGYNFTGCSGIYWKYNIYIALPAESKVLVYNFRNQWWEAPQTLPISRFSIIAGELYGHSNTELQTFKLFDGTDDNGQFIDARAVFAFNNYGTRSRKKTCNELFIDGYMQKNTEITAVTQYEKDGCAQITTNTLTGTDPQVCSVTSDAPLGKTPLGKHGLGNGTTSESTKPRFRVIFDQLRNPFFEVSYGFTSYGKDQVWEILAFGPRVSISPDISPEIHQ